MLWISWVYLSIFVFFFAIIVPSGISYAESAATNMNISTKFEKTIKKTEDSKKWFIESLSSFSGGISSPSASGTSDPADVDTTSAEDTSSSHTGIVKWIEEFYSKLVLETYKSQFKKNLKDLDITLKKIYPEKDDRIEAYKKIKQTYENILKNLKENPQSIWASMSKKQVKIYEEALNYLIGLILSRISTLEN